MYTPGPTLPSTPVAALESPKTTSLEQSKAIQFTGDGTLAELKKLESLNKMPMLELYYEISKVLPLLKAEAIASTGTEHELVSHLQPHFARGLTPS